MSDRVPDSHSLGISNNHAGKSLDLTLTRLSAFVLPRLWENMLVIQCEVTEPTPQEAARPPTPAGVTTQFVARSRQLLPFSHLFFRSLRGGINPIKMPE